MVHSTSIISELNREAEPSALNAYTVLRDRIVTLDLAPGALLSESSLGESLGLSRTPIREALKRLEREYLVAILPRRGIIITDVDVNTQLQLLEIRRGIEVRLVCRGTEKLSDEQRAGIATISTQMAKAAEEGNLAKYTSLDTEFDAHIDKAARNLFLTDAMKPVHALVRRFWFSQTRSAEMREAMQLHSLVIQAAARGDAHAVRQRLLDVYHQNERYFISLLT